MTNLRTNTLMRNATLLGVSITAGTVALLSTISTPLKAQNAAFPDTQNYWAQPFIAALAERNIVRGYPDGTFRPNETVDRDEFAAILRAAFNKPAERQIGSGSDYRDVPKGYWAAPAIKEAYEAGFMNGYPGGYFRPQQPVTKAEALVSLAQTLYLKPKEPVNQAAANTLNTLQGAATGTPNNQAQNNQAQAATPQPVRRRSFMLPLASTMLLQPFIAPVRQAAAALPIQQNTAPQAATKASTPQSQQQSNSAQPKRNYTQINQYYVDANQIPAYAAGSVAEATRSNIVVNHPNLRQLQPQRPATRGEVAAIVYQALVNQGQVPALGQDVPSSRYVVRAENINQPR